MQDGPSRRSTTIRITGGEAVQMGLSQAPEEMLRNPQLFGPIVEVPDDASARTS